LFHQKNKRTKEAPVKSALLAKGLIAVDACAEILSVDKRQVLIEKIKALSTLDLVRFDGLCLKLINQLTNYCQYIPETSNSYYALPGGILDYALNRAEAALSLFKEFMVQPDGEQPSEIQKLWMYALLTASLLKDIGKLQVDYLVKVFDPFGQYLKPWNPLIESLVAAGSYYQYEFLPDASEKALLRQRLNILLARLLMPNEGFAWIASDPEILAVWLALLSDDWQSAGTLGAILIRADGIAIQRYFDEHLIHHIRKQGGRGPARIGTFIDTKPDVSEAKDQATGIEFIKWLTKLLDSGQLMINKAPLLIVPGGLLIHPDAFKLFVRAHPQFKNWQAIQSGFMSLGLHQLNVNGDALSRFEQSNTHQMHEGVLFSDYAMALPPLFSMSNPATGKVGRISAIELVFLAQHQHLFVQQGHAATQVGPRHLTAEGKWKVLATTPGLKSGFLKGG
jgi:integrating conjugative element relaxase (TIGR03760 family)